MLPRAVPKAMPAEGVRPKTTFMRSKSRRATSSITGLGASTQHTAQEPTWPGRTGGQQRGVWHRLQLKGCKGQQRPQCRVCQGQQRSCNGCTKEAAKKAGSGGCNGEAARGWDAEAAVGCTAETAGGCKSAFGLTAHTGLHKGKAGTRGAAHLVPWTERRHGEHSQHRTTPPDTKGHQKGRHQCDHSSQAAHEACHRCRSGAKAALTGCLQTGASHGQ